LWKYVDNNVRQLRRMLPLEERRILEQMLPKPPETAG